MRCHHEKGATKALHTGQQHEQACGGIRGGGIPGTGRRRMSGATKFEVMNVGAMSGAMSVGTMSAVSGTVLERCYKCYKYWCYKCYKCAL